MTADSTSSRFDLRHAATDRPTIVTVGERRLFAIDGVGAPDGADYHLAAEILRDVAHRLRDRLRRERGVSTPVNVLETAWWTHPELAPDEIPDAFEDRRTWHWQQLVEVPDRAADDDVEAAIDETRRAAGRAAPLLRIVTLTEGQAAQMLHLGSEHGASETLRSLFALLAATGLTPRGHVHELRVADAGEVPPERVRTILRVPIQPLTPSR